MGPASISSAVSSISTGQAAVAQAPSASDVSQFQSLLSQSGGAGAVSPGAGQSLSSGMSEGIRSAAEAYRSRFDSLHAGIKRVEKSPSISSLMAWQLDSVKMGVEMEFTGKIASKLVQDIEQLTKQQG